MKNIHSISIKLKQTDKSNIDSIQAAMKAIDMVISGETEYHTVELSPAINMADLKQVLTDKFDLTNGNFRDGCLQGCYGSNTGRYDNGITVSIDADYWADRYIDSDGEEIINPVHLLDECNAKLIEGIDGDVFAESCEDIGLDVRSDNTYNYMGHSSEDPNMMFDFDFKWIEKNESGPIYLAVMFHYGGDVRGNYGSRHVFRFDSIDDAHSFIAPLCMLKDDEQ